MITLDKDLNNSLTLEELWQDNFTQYLEKLIKNEAKKEECNGGYVPPSFEEAFFAFIQTMKDTKERLEEKLQKANDTTIDLNALHSSTATNLLDTDEVLFNKIAKLTKLDKQTLAYNLENNNNFEENIISIVQELTQNVDALYASKNLNLSHLLQKALDIKV